MSSNRNMDGYKKVEFSGQDDTWRQQPAGFSSWRVQKGKPTGWRPPTDVYEIDDNIVVMVEIAGMRGMEFSVTLDKGVLLVRGVRADRGGAKAYQQMEISYGEFEAAVRLPAKVDSERIEATYGDGFLKVVLPKLKATRVSVNR